MGKALGQEGGLLEEKTQGMYVGENFGTEREVGFCVVVGHGTLSKWGKKSVGVSIVCV